MKCPVESSIQKAALAVCPAGRIAALSLRDTPTTLDRKLLAIINSSVTVDTSRLRGDILPSFDSGPSAPTLLTVLSSVQYTRLPVACSIQSFPLIPLKAGTDPVKTQLCPTAVKNGRKLIFVLTQLYPFFNNRLN